MAECKTGMEKFDPFHSIRFERERLTAADVFGVERSWVEILTNPRGENPIQEQHYQFLIEEYAPDTYVQKCRQVLFNEYFIFDRVVCRFHITLYVTKFRVFW